MTGARDTSPSFADKVTLRGVRVLLRPVSAGDAPGLLSCSRETLRLTGSHGEMTLSGLEHWYASRADHPDRLDLSIVSVETGRWLGEVVLNELHRDNRSCGFRILLAQEEDYGRGYGTEATSLVLRHAFETVGVNRVELEVYDPNPRAAQVYEKVGFVLEGTRRQALRWEGQWVDAHVMSILAEEWASHRGQPGVDPQT